MEVKAFTIPHKAALTDLLLNNTWSFHSGAPLTREAVEAKIDSGYYTRVGCKTFLLFEDQHLLGFTRIFDLGDSYEDDETPLFDIRIQKAHRGKGLGLYLVNWLVAFIFNNYPNKTRIEATTRQDNIAMRKVLEKAFFQKEAHYRKAWPTNEGQLFDAVGYGLLRGDWVNKKATPVQWNDLTKKNNKIT